MVGKVIIVEDITFIDLWMTYKPLDILLPFSNTYSTASSINQDFLARLSILLELLAIEWNSLYKNTSTYKIHNQCDIVYI